MLSHRIVRSAPRVASGLGVVAFALTLAPRARADAPPTREQCLTSHGKAQESRLEGELIEARTHLRVCSNPACPNVLQTECAAWLVSVQQAIPSVIILAENESGDVTNVRVVVDGKVVTEELDGKAFELDPGAHRFELELPGYPRQEQTIVIRQEEKRRAIRVVFAKESKPPSSENVGLGRPVEEEPKPVPRGPGSRPIPVATYVFGGVALAGAASATIFGVSGLADHSDKEDTCAPACSDADVDAVKTKLLLADISGGIAIVSAGLATYFYLTRPVVYEDEPKRASKPKSSFSVAVGSNGVSLGLSGAF
jgi:hypothetical protein